MQKAIGKTKEKLAEEIEQIIKQDSISPAQLEHLRKSFEVIETIKRIECCNDFIETKQLLKSILSK